MDRPHGFTPSRGGLDENPTRDLRWIGYYLRIPVITTPVLDKVPDVPGRFYVTMERPSGFPASEVVQGAVEFMGKTRNVIGDLKRWANDFGSERSGFEIPDMSLPVGDLMLTRSAILTGRAERTEAVADHPRVPTG